MKNVEFVMKKKKKKIDFNNFVNVNIITQYTLNAYNYGWPKNSKKFLKIKTMFFMNFRICNVIYVMNIYRVPI